METKYNKPEESWLSFENPFYYVLKKEGEFIQKFRNNNNPESERIMDRLLVKCKTCGEEKTINARSIYRCGCRKCPKPNTIEKIGTSIGDLLVTGIVKKDCGKEKRNFYKLKCERCFHTFEKRVGSEKKYVDLHFSCSKCNPNFGGMFSEPVFKKNIKTIYSSLKRGAKKRHLLFSINISDMLLLLEKQDGKCKLSGMEINIEDGTASLDRIDSLKGYDIDNIQWLHKKINFMKCTHSQDDFISLCSMVSSYSLRHA
jgi:hypothetical protein